jgi:hypothetical protein
MFEAYIDESGKDSPVFAVSGFVGPADEWAIFAEEWKAISGPTGITCYHAADCEGGFHEFDGWLSEKRIALNVALVDCLERRKIFGVGLAAIVNDFKAVMPTSSESLWHDLYVELFENVVIQAANRIAQIAPGQQLAVICHRFQNTGAATQAFWALADEPLWDNRNKLESIVFADKRKFMPLQAADKAAYETYRHCTNQLADPRQRTRRAMYRFNDLPFHCAICDKHTFLQLKNEKSKAGDLIQWEQ